MNNEELNLELRKALDTSSAHGGDKLIPEIVSGIIRRFVRERTTFYNLFSTTPWATKFYTTRALTDLPTADFATDGGALPAESDSTYDKPFWEMKYIYSKGRVTGPELAATQNVVDLWHTEILNHTKALLKKLEQVVLTGDATADPKQFDGLAKQITQSLDASPDAGTTKPALTLANMDEVADLPEEYPTHWFMSKAMHRRLWALLQAQQRFTNDIEVAAGFMVPTYNHVPIIRAQNYVTGLENTVLAPNLDYCTIAMLRDIFFKQTGQSYTEDTESFFIGSYQVLVVEGAGVQHAKIINVSDS